MRNRYSVSALVLAMLVVLAAADAGAQFYAIDNYHGYVYAYEDTIATRVNPDTLVPYAEGAAVDHQGRIVMATTDGEWDVVRLDIDAQTIDYLDTAVPGWTARRAGDVAR